MRAQARKPGLTLSTQEPCSTTDNGSDFSKTLLILHRATNFWDRLRGLHAWPVLPWHVGLYLAPCQAIHTFGLGYAIDVVFLDEALNEVKRVDALAPCRVAYCLKAAAAVELPAGYCAANPAYAQACRIALR